MVTYSFHLYSRSSHHFIHYYYYCDSLLETRKIERKIKKKNIYEFTAGIRIHDRVSADTFLDDSTLSSGTWEENRDYT